MDVSAITQLISNVGFPIACCIAMYITLNKQSQNHKEEMAKLAEVVNQNTIAVTELSTMLKGGD